MRVKEKLGEKANWSGGIALNDDRMKLAIGKALNYAAADGTSATKAIVS